MIGKNLLAILMAGIMLATTFSAISVNAANNTPVSTSVGTTTTMEGQVNVHCRKLVWINDMPYAKGVSGVTVSVQHDKDRKIVVTGTTDAYGRVSFNLLQWMYSGYYFTLFFDNPDYKHKPYNFPLYPGENCNIDIDMQKRDVSSTPSLPSATLLKDITSVPIPTDLTLQ